MAARQDIDMISHRFQFDCVFWMFYRADLRKAWTACMLLLRESLCLFAGPSGSFPLSIDKVDCVRVVVCM